MKWAGHVARIEYRRAVYMVLVGKREGKRPFETPRHRRVLILKGSSGSVMWGQ